MVLCAHAWHVGKEVTVWVQPSSNVVNVLHLFLTIFHIDLLLHTVKLHSLKLRFQFYECQIQAALQKYASSLRSCVSPCQTILLGILSASLIWPLTCATIQVVARVLELFSDQLTDGNYHFDLQMLKIAVKRTICVMSPHASEFFRGYQHDNKCVYAV